MKFGMKNLGTSGLGSVLGGSYGGFLGALGDEGMAQIPIVGGMFDDSDEKMLDELRGNKGLFAGIGLPSSKWEEFSPDFYTPEDAVAQTTAEDPALRMKQLEALSKMEELSQQGLSPEDELGFLRARQMGDQMAKGKTEAAINDAQVRGVAGGGQEFAAREAAAQAAAQRSQEAALQQAAQAAQQRQAYLQAYANQAGAQRSQDFSHNKANTDVINQFNMANTQAKNLAGQNNVNLKNDAQMYNQQGKRDMSQQRFNNEITRAGGQAQANTGMASGYAAQNAARSNDRNSFMGLAGKIGASYAGGG